MNAWGLRFAGANRAGFLLKRALDSLVWSPAMGPKSEQFFLTKLYVHVLFNYRLGSFFDAELLQEHQIIKYFFSFMETRR